MANYTSVLKPFAWITADDLGEWLYDEKTDRYIVPTAGEKATLTEQFVTYISQSIGVIGNSITIEYIAGGTKGNEIVTVTSQNIQVQIEDGVSTAEDIRAAISANGPASALVSIQLSVVSPDTLPDVQVRTQNIVGPLNLVGGLDDTPFPKQDVPYRRKRFEAIINSSCQKIEQILGTNVIAKDYQEDLDGNDSNVIIPSMWPMISLQDIRIDFNRNFGAETVVSSLNTLFRGMADRRMDITAPELRIVGDNVYLRDDDSNNVIGRVFSGSVAGSVRIKYKAGWAKDIQDVPSDLRLAALQLAEWFEFRRSNKDIGISSKGVRGESYSKSEQLEEGIPVSIYGLIQSYKNESFGTFERSQNNIFGL